MKVKLVKSTHILGKELEGVDVDLNINLTLNFRFNPYKVEPESDKDGYVITNGEYYDFELRRGTYSTSLIKEIKYEEISRGCYLIICNTRNNSYVFQYGEKSDLKPFTDKEILDLQIALGMHLF